MFSLWMTTFYILGLAFYLSWFNFSTSLPLSGSLKYFYKYFLDNDSLINFKNLLIEEPQLIISLFFFIFYFLFKLGAGPFYTWTVEVYSSCSSGILIAVSLIPKLVYFFVLFVILYLNFLPLYFLWSNLLLTMGLLTIFFGSLGIIQAFKLKEIYAWSSLIHTGNILCIFSCISKETISLMYFYIFNYVFISIGFIFIFLSLKNRQTGRFIKTTHELFSVNGLMSLFSLPAIIVLASSAGFTPFASFFMKFSLFSLLSQTHSPFLALFVGFFNIIGSSVYLKILRSLIGFNINSFENRKNTFYSSSVSVELSYKLSIILNLCLLIIVLGFPLYLDFISLTSINTVITFF